MSILDRDVAAFSYRELLSEEVSRRLRRSLLERDDQFEQLCASGSADTLSYAGAQKMYDALLREVGVRLPLAIVLDLETASRPELAAVISRFVYAPSELFEPKFGDDPAENGKIIADNAADLGFLLAMSGQYDASFYLSGSAHLMLNNAVTFATISDAA